MSLVLDTHAWLWWASAPERLGSAARAAVDAAETVGIATISCWEVAMLVRGGRIGLDREVRTWIRQALGLPGVLALPLSPQAATDAALLDPDEFPGDPADRLIYATARERGVPLISKDRALRAYDPRGVLWD